MTVHRDLLGYRDAPPLPDWPGGARLAVSFVVNVEEGSELFIADGDERNESLYEIREAVEAAPDLCMASHFAYGTRVGVHRVLAAFAAADRFATFSCCGRTAERVPALLADFVQAGHEVACHGWRWERHAGMNESVERQRIANTAEAIEAATGQPPCGWHTRSSASVHTRRLLVEHGGFLYDSDAYDDDTPRIETVSGQPHVVLPYAFDTNDMRFAPGGGFVQPDDFTDYVTRAFERLLAEGGRRARMLSIGLHLRIIGRPARIGALETLLERIGRHPEVWCTTRRELALHWRRRFGLDREPSSRGTF